MSVQHAEELRDGQRFAFGQNWQLFLSEVDEDRIDLAARSLREMLGVVDLRGKTLIDVGSGSGLFSLAARRMGARVRSFDYDPSSVACTQELKKRYFPQDPDWTVQQGSVLDRGYIESLGAADLVYSWGVLHHTGDQEAALENVSGMVRDNGQLFIALYNDQGRPSRMWLRVKQAYNRLPSALRWIVLMPAALRLWGPTMIRDMLRGRPFHTWRNYSKGSLRGMSPWRDLVDWVGGLPFEVSTPEQIFDFYRARGFALERLKTCAGGHGCNEYVFRKIAIIDSP